MDPIQTKQALRRWLDADPARCALPYSEIARACGLEEHASHRSLRRWAAELIDAPPEPTLEEPSELEDDLASYQQDYFYSVDRDTYVFNLTAYPKPLALSGEIVRRIQAHYSRDGANATIEEMSRSLGWSRTDFEEVRKALGLTHASHPLPPAPDEHRRHYPQPGRQPGPVRPSYPRRPRRGGPTADLHPCRPGRPPGRRPAG